MKTLTKKIGDIGTVRRKRVEARAAALIAEEMTLQELRQARKLTQVRLAKTLGITQDGVSRLEVTSRMTFCEAVFIYANEQYLVCRRMIFRRRSAKEDSFFFAA